MFEFCVIYTYDKNHHHHTGFSERSQKNEGLITGPKLNIIQKIKTAAYRSDQNSIHLKMTKWVRILETIHSL